MTSRPVRVTSRGVRVTSRGVRVTSRGYRYWYLNVVPIIIVLVVPRLIVRIALYSATIHVHLQLQYSGFSVEYFYLDTI